MEKLTTQEIELLNNLSEKITTAEIIDVDIVENLEKALDESLQKLGETKRYFKRLEK